MTADKPLPTGRGRPPKFASPAALPHLLHLLDTVDCTFAEACARARTTPYLLKQMMMAAPEIEFEIRLACLRHPRKRLSESWGRPEIVLEATLEAHRLDAGERARSWAEVQASIRKRQEEREMGPAGDSLEAAMARDVTIRPARTPEEECF